ncbi:unnamed protein product [Linum trigynum]|uniref:Reverse transcriptase domain-containing protein n=1 Tax=Linum trigynum TaxID=586398 RepID=A0AAV2DWC0_9ROSI
MARSDPVFITQEKTHVALLYQGGSQLTWNTPWGLSRHRDRIASLGNSLKPFGILCSSVSEAVCSFFSTSRMLRSFNHMWLTLIPKVDNVENMTQLRPISLCQFVYKIITKIMAERLACFLPQVISEGQNAFIRERQIIENILIGHESMHYLKIKTLGKKGYMALKVDMEKAYDRVKWSFLLAVLTKMGFNSTWCGWIHECLRSLSFSVLMNGTPSGYLTPSRGLLQDYPLSPLLFVIYTEGFVTILRKVLTENKLGGVKVAPRAPRISHIFFADDSYLFLRGTLLECENLIEALNEYEELNGQRVNLAKSVVCFSKNISPQDQEFLAAILGVRVVGVHDKYLGLPKLLARSKMATFRYLEEKLLERLQGWKQRTLSWEAKETLIKSISMAFPMHVMSYFKLTVSLCRLLDRHAARFWWGRWRASPRFDGCPGVTCAGVNMRGEWAFADLSNLIKPFKLKLVGVSSLIPNLCLPECIKENIFLLAPSLLPQLDPVPHGGGRASCLVVNFWKGSSMADW